MVSKIRQFITEVTLELKKVSWSTKSELKDSAMIVLLSSLILGVFIGTTDFALSKLITIIIR